MPDLFSVAFCISGRKEKGCLSLGCFEKIPLTGWLKQETFVTVLNVETSKIKVQADSVSVEDMLPGLQKTVFLLCVHMEKKRKFWFSSLLVRALSASEGSILVTSFKSIYLPKTPAPNITLEIRVSAYEHSAHSKGFRG